MQSSGKINNTRYDHPGFQINVLTLDGTWVDQIPSQKEWSRDGLMRKLDFPLNPFPILFVGDTHYEE